MLRTCEVSQDLSSFRADSFVLRTDQGNLQALMSFEHIYAVFLLLLLCGPSEAAISCAM